MTLQAMSMLGLQWVYCVARTTLPTADHRPVLDAGWMTSGPGLTHTLLRRPWVRGADMIQTGRGGPSEANMNQVEWGGPSEANMNQVEWGGASGANMNQVEWGGAFPVKLRIGRTNMDHQPMKPVAHLHSAVR